MTQISAPGNKPGLATATAQARGFTLIELLVVMALLAIATATLSLALRDPAGAQLEREAERLAALFESARAEARAAGLSVYWAPVQDDSGDHFRFMGLPAKLQAQLPRRWLGQPPAIDMLDGRTIRLGPEPMIGAQRLRLRLGDQRLLLSTDGLGPFTPGTDDAATP